MNNRTKEELWSAASNKVKFDRSVMRLQSKFRSRKDLLAKLDVIITHIYMVKNLRYNVCGKFSERELIYALEGVQASFDKNKPLKSF